MDDDDEAILLIEGAMEDVRVIDCPHCKGRGKRLDLLNIDCDDCHTSGKTTGVIVHGD